MRQLARSLGRNILLEFQSFVIKDLKAMSYAQVIVRFTDMPTLDMITTKYKHQGRAFTLCL